VVNARDRNAGFEEAGARDSRKMEGRESRETKTNRLIILELKE